MKENIAFIPGSNGPKLLPQQCRKRTSKDANLLISIDEDNSTFQLFLLGKKGNTHHQWPSSQITYIVNVIP